MTAPYIQALRWEPRLRGQEWCTGPVDTSQHSDIPKRMATQMIGEVLPLAVLLILIFLLAGLPSLTCSCFFLAKLHAVRVGVGNKTHPSQFGGPLLASGDDASSLRTLLLECRVVDVSQVPPTEVLRNVSIFRASFNMVAANELRGLDFLPCS